MMQMGMNAPPTPSTGQLSNPVGMRPAADLMETAAQWTADAWDAVTANAVTKTKTEPDPSAFRPIPAKQVTRRNVKLGQVVKERLKERKRRLHRAPSITTLYSPRTPLPELAPLPEFAAVSCF